MMLDVDEIKGQQCLDLENDKIKIGFSSFYFFYGNYFFGRVYEFLPQPSSYGHTTVKAPHPIRTAKLSTVGLVQYFGRGLQGNHQCCMAPF